MMLAQQIAPYSCKSLYVFFWVTAVQNNMADVRPGYSLNHQIQTLRSSATKVWLIKTEGSIGVIVLIVVYRHSIHPPQKVLMIKTEGSNTRGI